VLSWNQSESGGSTWSPISQEAFSKLVGVSVRSRAVKGGKPVSGSPDPAVAEVTKLLGSVCAAQDSPAKGLEVFQLGNLSGTPDLELTEMVTLGLLKSFHRVLRRVEPLTVEGDGPGVVGQAPNVRQGEVDWIVVQRVFGEDAS
jgi:hypothetical protein